MENINHRNYRRGLIKGYELAFQDPEWYEANKNNFSNSMRQNYPESVPEYAKNSNTKNFLGFLPDDLIRFGYLEKVELKIGEQSFPFWVSKIPQGFSLYHSSRSLALNHADFPLIGYDNRKDKEENRSNSETLCPVSSFIEKDACTYVTYYSTPYLSKGYLKRGNKGYAGNAVKYAYGVSPISQDKDPLYNDRLTVNAKVKDNKVFVTESREGVFSYVTKKDTYLFILGIDDILIDRPNLGKENMNTFYRIMYYNRPTVVKNGDNYNRFLNLILSVSGIGTLGDNINNIKKDYPSATGFEAGLKEWISNNAQYYSKNPLPTAGRISSFSSSDLSKIPGLRFSTFEHDRPVLNMLSYLFKTYPSYNIQTKSEDRSQRDYNIQTKSEDRSQRDYDNKENKVEVSGFVSSSLYVYSKGKGDITTGEIFTIGDLSFYSSRSYFHSELGLFFAPDVLERNRNNKYDVEYDFNYLGLVQEYRKFKTSNTDFHSGHLLEHNNWVGLVASILREEPLYQKYGSIDIADKNIYLLAGFLHDLGKSGDCTVKPVYRNLNPQDAKMSVCKYVKDDNEIVGLSYGTIPEHPDKGYEYLKGYKTYKKYTLNGRENEVEYNRHTQKLYLKDWDNFFNHLGINEFSKRLIRITVGAHWYFGDFIRRLTVNPNLISSLAQEYCRKLETFYTDEFDFLNKEDFKRVCIFVVIISIADIYGSEYNPRRELTDEEYSTVKNYLPNISLNNVGASTTTSNSSSSIVTAIILKSLNNNLQNTNKRKIFENLRLYSERFLRECLSSINKWEFSPNNNYSLLFNLKSSYPSLSDIKIAYPNDFPKVITFDLDQTLFAAKFSVNKLTEYKIYPDTAKVLEECQRLRELGVRIAITSRHYAPKALRQLLNRPNNPLYFGNFDFIVSRYTGSIEKIRNDVSNYPNFFEINGAPSEGFIMDNTGRYFNIPDNSKFLDLNKISKHGHYDLLRKKYNIDYSDILAFDDDSIYFKKDDGRVDSLGLAKDVFIAAVIPERGIDSSLFKEGVAFYVFNQLSSL